MLVLFTDSDCDITPDIAKYYGFELISMPYTINEKEIETLLREDMKNLDYYLPKDIKESSLSNYSVRNGIVSYNESAVSGRVNRIDNIYAAFPAQVFLRYPSLFLIRIRLMLIISPSRFLMGIIKRLMNLCPLLWWSISRLEIAMVK